MLQAGKIKAEETYTNVWKDTSVLQFPCQFPVRNIYSLAAIASIS